MSAGSTSQRFAQPKIEFACDCGKKYRVSADKAGKHIRCKNCRVRVQVPGDDAGISARTRTAILDELGINTELKAGGGEAKTEKYACSLCGAKIKAVSGAYAEAGLVCDMCRETMGGGAATEAPDGTKKKKKKKQKQLDTWTRGTDPTAARNKALAYGGLFFIGTLGFSLNVLSLGWLGGLALASAVSYVGGKAIFTSHLADPVQAKTIK